MVEVVIVVLADVVVLTNEVFVYLCGNFISICVYVCLYVCGVKGSDGRMDDGYTEHSGCPVLEGEKWITTVWMRDGVLLPWSLFGMYMYNTCYVCM